MKNNIAAAIILIALTLTGFSQNKTFVGGEASMTGDIYDIIDPCNLITTTPLIKGSWGITLGQEINKNFLVETGLIRKYYDYGIGYNTESVVTGTSGYAYNTWQIPFRLKSKINLLNEKLFLIAFIGYHISINTDYGYGGSGSGGFIKENDTINLTYTVNNSIAKTFSLLETGLGFEFVVFDGLILSITSSYYTGFKKVLQLDITTDGNNCHSEKAYAFSKGNYWNISFGVKYDVSRLWGKNKNGN